MSTVSSTYGSTTAATPGGTDPSGALPWEAGGGSTSASVLLASVVASLSGEWWDKRSGITIGTGVSAWVGRVAGQTLSQGTAANQPSFNATTGVTFDGVNDSLVGAANFLQAKPEWTFMFVGTWAQGATVGDALCYGAIATGNARFRVNGATTGLLTMFFGGASLGIQNNWQSASLATTGTPLPLGVYMGQGRMSDGAATTKAVQGNAASLNGSRINVDDMTAVAFAASSISLGTYTDGTSNPAACSFRHAFVFPLQVSQAAVNTVTALSRAIEGF